MTVIKWDISSKCNRACVHSCNSETTQYCDELPPERINDLLDQMAAEQFTREGLLYKDACV